MLLAGCTGDRPPEEMSFRLRRLTTCRSLLSRDSSPRPWLCLPKLRRRVSELSGPQPSPEQRPKSRRLSEGGKPIDAQRLRFLPKPSCCPRFPSKPACRPGTPCPVLRLQALPVYLILILVGFCCDAVRSGCTYTCAAFVLRHTVYLDWHISQFFATKSVQTCTYPQHHRDCHFRSRSPKHFPLRLQVHQLRPIRTSALQVSGLSRHVCNSSQQDRCVERTTPDLACWPAYRRPESLYILMGV
jgi:hypothetical protein